MKDTYRKFVTALTRCLDEEWNAEEETVAFCPGTEKNEDLLRVSCITEGGAREYCDVRVLPLYERWNEGKPVREIAEDVLAHLRRIAGAGHLEAFKKLDNYEEAKPRLILRLVSLQSKGLEGCAHEMVGDMALALYMILEEERNQLVSVKVPERYLQTWHKSWKEVCKDVMDHMMQENPPVLFCLEDLIPGNPYAGKPLSEADERYFREERYYGECLSTSKKVNGAVAVFYPGVGSRIASLIGGDFYMAFTSIHEVMLHPVDAVDKAALSEILRETIEAATAPEEFLSFGIFRYYRCEDAIRQVC